MAANMDPKVGFKGLVTAVGELMAERGALRIADNVTLRKEGALTLRSLFGSTALARAYRAAVPYKGSLFFLGGLTTPLYGPNETLVSYDTSLSSYGNPATSGPIRQDIQSAKEARGNLYLAASNGVFKVSSASSPVMYAAGIGMVSNFFGVISPDTSGTPLLTANQRVAYRLVTKYTDANGFFVRSRPTGAVPFVTGATAASPVVGIKAPYYPPGSAVKAEVELYRTRIFPSSVAVDDEMQLVGTFQGTFAGTPNIVFTDRIPDAARGTTLYTSPSRGGAENANDRPPGCACLERYRTSLFFGNTRSPSRVTVSFKWSGDVTGLATGLGGRAVTASWTSGSANVTVNNATGIVPGMPLVINSTPPYSTTFTPIVASVAGTTVTMTQPATSTRSGVAGWFYDAFYVFDPVYQTWTGPYQLPTPPGAGVGYTSGGSSLSVYLNSGGSGVNAYEVTPPQPGYDFTIVIEAHPRGQTSFAVRATHGDEYSPAIALGNSSTGTPGTFDDFPHGLAWSEPDEPEHVPPKNFARVGDSGKAILSLIATRDRLLIFKEDGLFMLVGDTSRNFSIYPLDTTCLCILPGSVTRLQNTVFALTNLGLVAVDESGSVRVVSRPIQTEIAPIVTAIRTAQKASGFYNMPGLAGITGTSDDANGEAWLMLGTSNPSFGGQVLVYNAAADGFTTYSFGTPAPVCVSKSSEGEPLVLTASTLLAPSTALGAIVARISPRAFSDPALMGRMASHVAVAFSKLTGTTSVQARFSGSELGTTEIAEMVEAGPVVAGLIEQPNGSLLRSLIPSPLKRSFLTFVELVVSVASGTFTLEHLALEERENIPNKRPSHGTGST